MLFLMKNFIYLPVSNAIIKVNPLVRDVLNLMKENNDKRAILKRLSICYKEEEITTAITEIENFNKKLNLFDFERPYFTRAIFPYSTQEIYHNLNKRLSHMILDITWDCNFACKYCKYSGIYRGERVNTEIYMSKEIIEKALLFLKNHSSESERLSIGFYGGEPLLAFENIKYAVFLAEKIFTSKEIRFSLTTNGSLLLRKEIRRFLREHDFSVNVSIDGPKEIHDRYRVNRLGRPTFNFILRGLRAFKQESPEYFMKKVGYIVTLTPPFNLDLVMDFLNEWDCKTDGPIFVSLVDPYETDFYKRFSTEVLASFDKQLDELIEESLKKDIPEGKINEFLHQFLYKDLFIYHNSPKGNLSKELFIGGFCIPGYDRTFVTPDGSIYPCERVHYHLKIGDIFDGFNFKRIKEIIEEVEHLKNENCLECPIARLCNICYTSIYRSGKLRKDLFYTACKSRRRHWEKVLKIYARIKDTYPDFFALWENKKEGHYV